MDKVFSGRPVFEATDVHMQDTLHPLKCHGAPPAKHWPHIPLLDRFVFLIGTKVGGGYNWVPRGQDSVPCCWHAHRSSVWWARGLHWLFMQHAELHPPLWWHERDRAAGAKGGWAQRSHTAARLKETPSSIIQPPLLLARIPPSAWQHTPPGGGSLPQTTWVKSPRHRSALAWRRPWPTFTRCSASMPSSYTSNSSRATPHCSRLCPLAPCPPPSEHAAAFSPCGTALRRAPPRARPRWWWGKRLAERRFPGYHSASVRYSSCHLATLRQTQLSALCAHPDLTKICRFGEVLVLCMVLLKEGGVALKAKFYGET